METLPFLLDLPTMDLRIQSLPTEQKKISVMLNLFQYKEDGIITTSQLVKLFRRQNIAENIWHLRVAEIETEPGLYLFSKTLSFYERCGKITISRCLREAVQNQLNIIYKNTMH